MADHLQQQLLDAYKATLIAASTAAGSNVFLDRVDEVPQASLPALHIEGQGETIESTSVDWSQIQERAYTFTVSCVTGLATGAAAAARNLGKQVEQALFAAQATSTASGKAKALRLEGSTEGKDGGAATSLYLVRQTWVVTYITLSGAPDTPY